MPTIANVLPKVIILNYYAIRANSRILARKRSKELVAQLQSQVEDLTKEKGELKRSNDVMKAQLELLEQQNRALMMNQLTAQVGTQQQLNTLGNQLGNLSSNLNTNNLSTNVSAAPILATNNLFVAPNAGLLGAQPTMAAATNPMLAGALTADPTSAAVTNPLMAVQMGAQGTPNPAASQPALLERLLAERLATQQNPLAQNVQGLVSAPGQTFVATDLQGSVMGPVDGTSFLG